MYNSHFEESSLAASNETTVVYDNMSGNLTAGNNLNVNVNVNVNVNINVKSHKLNNQNEHGHTKDDYRKQQHHSSSDLWVELEGRHASRMSESFSRVLGASNELISRPVFTSLIHPADLQGFLDFFHGCLIEGRKRKRSELNEEEKSIVLEEDDDNEEGGYDEAKDFVVSSCLTTTKDSQVEFRVISNYYRYTCFKVLETLIRKRKGVVGQVSSVKLVLKEVFAGSKDKDEPFSKRSKTGFAVLFGKNFVFEHVSPACLSILKTSPYMLVEKSLFDFTHPEDLLSIKDNQHSKSELFFRVSADCNQTYEEFKMNLKSQPNENELQVVILSKKTKKQTKEEENISNSPEVESQLQHNSAKFSYKKLQVDQNFFHIPHRRSYKKAPKNFASEKRCESCKTNTTPEWRKGPNGPKTLCNACGLHYSKSKSLKKPKSKKSSKKNKCTENIEICSPEFSATQDGSTVVPNKKIKQKEKQPKKSKKCNESLGVEGSNLGTNSKKTSTKSMNVSKSTELTSHVPKSLPTSISSSPRSYSMNSMNSIKSTSSINNLGYNHLHTQLYQEITLEGYTFTKTELETTDSSNFSNNNSFETEMCFLDSPGGNLSETHQIRRLGTHVNHFSVKEEEEEEEDQEDEELEEEDEEEEDDKQQREHQHQQQQGVYKEEIGKMDFAWYPEGNAFVVGSSYLQQQQQQQQQHYHHFHQLEPQSQLQPQYPFHQIQQHLSQPYFDHLISCFGVFPPPPPLVHPSSSSALLSSLSSLSSTL